MFCYYVIGFGVSRHVAKGRDFDKVESCCQEVNFIPPKVVAANGELLKVTQEVNVNFKVAGLDVVYPALIVKSLPQEVILGF